MKPASPIAAIMALSAGLLSSAWGQSIYVDMDVGIGGPDVGQGAPSSGFGAAAGVPGAWNCVPGADDGPWPLSTTQGLSPGISMTWDGYSAFGYRNLNNTGDFRALFNDGTEVDGGVTFTISGLLPGGYRVVTYVTRPQGTPVDVLVTVPGSTTPNPQLVTGPQLGNQLIQGQIYAAQDVALDGGPLLIHAEGGGPGNNAYVNGFQVLAVPEPATVIGSVLGLAALASRRIK